MRLVARTTQAAAIVAVGLLGAVFIAEATGAIGEGWRNSAADAVKGVGLPSAAPWILAPVGLMLGLAALTLAVVQFAPPRKGARLMLPVHDFDDGSTVLAGRALIHVVDKRLAGIEGVLGVDARVTHKRVDIELRVDDRADLELVDTQARLLLDHGFWIDLGVADLAVDLTVVHHPRPPRVR